MEQQKKKKKKRNIEEKKKKKDSATEDDELGDKRRRRRRKRTQSKSALSFPFDLTSEILLRLPAKSLLRFQCVSKLWSSITTDPYFIKLFDTRSSALQPSLLICFQKGDELFVSSFPQPHPILYSSTKPTYRYRMKFPKFSFFFATESVHGLICFQESATPIVWNPIKRQFLSLPTPRLRWKLWDRINVFLGYDPVGGKHKVMCIPSSSFSYVCRVLTLGSAQEPWITVKTNHKHRPSNHGDNSGQCIKGVIYYLADFSETGQVIMSFNVKSENFHMVQLPSEILIPTHLDITKDVLLTYMGRLACLDIRNGRRLWILEDAEKHKWSTQDFLVPFAHFDDSFELTGFTDAGEFIYVPIKFHHSVTILLCDPMGISCRRFKFEGIGDGERPYVLQTFPTHIDTIASLL